MKKLLVTLMVLALIFSVVALPAQVAQAASFEDVATTQKLPSFIPDGAVLMTDAEMDEVRREVFVLPPIIIAAIYSYGVPYVTKYIASLGTGSWILKQSIKHMIKKYFDW